MKSLPDPRTYAVAAGEPLALLAEKAAIQGSALQHDDAEKILVAAVDSVLASGDAGQISRALSDSTSARARRALHRAAELACNPPQHADLAVRVFAVPLVMVAGGVESGRIPGVIPDVSALRSLFESHGALGPARNFGLGNALVAARALSGFSPALLYAISHGQEQPDLRQFDFAPADIELVGADEQAHLRFLVGAVVTPRQAPDFTETAGNIGAWGMPFTRELSGQLAQAGMSLLPIPRPPMGFTGALQAGRFAWREIGFQLFLSNNLRKFRSRTGEPDVFVASFADGSVRVRLDSRLDDSFNAEFTWPLDPDDDLAMVGESILGLLAECRLDFVDVADAVQPVSASH